MHLVWNWWKVLSLFVRYDQKRYGFYFWLACSVTEKKSRLGNEWLTIRNLSNLLVCTQSSCYPEQENSSAMDSQIVGKTGLFLMDLFKFGFMPLIKDFPTFQALQTLHSIWTLSEAKARGGSQSRLKKMCCNCGWAKGESLPSFF